MRINPKFACLVVRQAIEPILRRESLHKNMQVNFGIIVILVVTFLHSVALAQEASGFKKEETRQSEASRSLLPHTATTDTAVEKDSKKDALKSAVSDNAQEKQPIVINGDIIEYSKEKNTVTIEGNVTLTKEDSILTCDKAVVNTLTNDAHAEGNVILKDKQGVIKASSCDYNFKSKIGQAYDAKVASHPYYGAGKIIKKVSEREIEIKNGYFTTCDKEHPHYRIQSRSLEMFPGDKVTARAMTLRVANTPLFYMPKFSQNLKDDRMHVEVTPGKHKDWGVFLLSAWRYDLLPGSGGRVHLDYREKKDFAWGIDNYYDTKKAGAGYFKTYYMNERNLGRKRLYKYPRTLKETTDTQRYRIQWRHKWEVQKNEYWLAEYHKVTDTKFIKDYFFREYEKDSQPPSYLLYNRIIADTSTLSILTRKRTNRIFSETEKLPEIKFDQPSTRIFETPVYFLSNSSYTNFNKKTATLPGNDWESDEANQRVDSYNKLSLPFKFAFLDLNPFAGTRLTYFQRIAGRQAGVFREIWDSGMDITTRFYRIFDVEADPFGLEIHQLRHILSPTIGWAYTHPPTVSSSKLLQFDGIDSIGEANQMNFSLENKLQTKRKNKTVDFLRLITSTNYYFKIEGRKRQWNPDVIFDLEMLPYDWLRFETDAKLDRKKGLFTTANFDLKASGKGISWGGGYRYEKGSSSQMTGEITCDLIKGWSLSVYERLQFMGNSLFKEQTYKISKELHCWIFDINYNVLRERGETVWFALRLKAFPGMSLDYNQNYHEPKPMSQGYAGGKSSD